MTHDVHVESVNYEINLSEEDILELMRNFECGDRCQLLVGIENDGATNVRYDRNASGGAVLRFTLPKFDGLALRLYKIELGVKARLFNV